MKILKSVLTNTDPERIYDFVKSQNYHKLSDLEAGTELNVNECVVYEDDSDEDAQRVAVLRSDNDNYYVSVSSAVVREVSDIIDIFGNKPFVAVIGKGVSNNNREYTTITKG